MAELQLDTGSGKYPIRISRGELHGLGEFTGTERRVMVITDNHVADHYLDAVEEILGDCDSLVLPAGEQFKTVDTLHDIWDELATRKFPRDGLLVALGGGVIGDITGFAAATWMRGTGFVQLPTTLLAQVDASVGGKTAVNLDAGKNLVGAFHQPEAVLIDISTLDTLPDREYSAGLAEVVKAALISGEEFLSWMDDKTEALAKRDAAAIEEAILRSCRLKADIVAEDERESGRRAVLNLGHTFGHAIETGLGHGEWLHGEAVAAGLVLALRLSEAECGLDSSVREVVTRMLEAFKLPTEPPGALQGAKILDLMSGDKKAQEGTWRLITLSAPGAVEIRKFRDISPVREVLGLD